MHHTAPIDRWSLCYWLYGGGAWVPRWECTQHDLWLFVFWTAAVTWMAAEYGLYGWRTWRAAKISRDVERTHLEWLTVVFVQCLLLHVATVLIGWFMTPYYVIVAGYLANAVACRLLNRSKLRLLHQQQGRAIREESQRLVDSIEAAAPSLRDDHQQLLSIAANLRRLVGKPSEQAASGSASDLQTTNTGDKGRP